MSTQTETKQTHTVVVEFPEGVSPTYSYGMEALGGRVVAVAFDGNRLEVEMDLLEALQELLSVADDYAYMEECNKARRAIAKANGES